jgi:hypothetical protein
MDRAFHVMPASQLHLDHIMVTGFRTTGDSSSDGERGGAILNDGGNIQLTYTGIGPVSAQIPDRAWGYLQVDNQGGAIFTRSGDVTISNSRIDFGEAANGGGIYVESGTLSIDGQTRLLGNYAHADGGAINIQSGTLTTQGTTLLEENAAQMNGGALFVGAQASATLNQQVTMNRSGVEYHYVPEGPNQIVGPPQGVAIYNLGTTVVEGNSAITESAGDAIYNDGHLKLNGVSIADNVGASVITNRPDGYFTFWNSSFTGNTVAGVAGSQSLTEGAVINEAGWMRIDNVQFDHNSTSFVTGGLIHNSGISADMAIHDSVFELNKNFPGPIVANHSGSLVVHGSQFLSNYNDNFGFYASGTAIRNLGVHELVQNESISPVELTAQVDLEQDIILVNDVSPFSRLPLPLKILVRSDASKTAERMTVTAIDDYRQALIVERTSRQLHVVSSEVRTYLDDTQEYMVVVDPEKYTHYRLPFDLIIDNEVMTVTEINGDILTLVRGRRETLATEHYYPFNAWAASGGLRVTNTEFADNYDFDNDLRLDPELTPSIQRIPNPSEIIHNFVHPHAFTTIVESTTFFNNARHRAASLGDYDELMANGYAVDIRTSRGLETTYRTEALEANGPEESPPERETILGEDAWIDPTASLYVENTVFSAQPTDLLNHTPAVIGTLRSGGGNFVDADLVNRFGIESALTETETTIVAPRLVGELPEIPFLAQIGHVWRREWQREYVLVTAKEEGSLDGTTELTIERGYRGTATITHPVDAQFAISDVGFWHPADRIGFPSTETKNIISTDLNEPNGITSGTTTIHVDNPNRFPPAPFRARLVGLATIMVEGEPTIAEDSEDILVNQVNGYELTIGRGTNARTFNDKIRLDYFEFVDARLDAKLARHVPVGEDREVLIPLPGSPLLDSGIDEAYLAHFATLSSTLAADVYDLRTRVYFALGSGNFETDLVGYTFHDSTTIVVSSVEYLPTVPFIMKIADELVEVTDVDAPNLTLTVSRGAFGTYAQDYPVGTSAAFGKPITSSGTQTRLLVESASQASSIASLNSRSLSTRVVHRPSNKSAFQPSAQPGCPRY